MTSEFDKAMNEMFAQGVRYALSDLEEVYGEGIYETDLWQEWMNDEDSK